MYTILSLHTIPDMKGVINDANTHVCSHQLDHEMTVDHLVPLEKPFDYVIPMITQINSNIPDASGQPRTKSYGYLKFLDQITKEIIYDAGYWLNLENNYKRGAKKCGCQCQSINNIPEDCSNRHFYVNDRLIRIYQEYMPPTMATTQVKIDMILPKSHTIFKKESVAITKIWTYQDYIYCNLSNKTTLILDTKTFRVIETKLINYFCKCNPNFLFVGNHPQNNKSIATYYDAANNQFIQSTRTFIKWTIFDGKFCAIESDETTGHLHFVQFLPKAEHEIKPDECVSCSLPLVERCVLLPCAHAIYCKKCTNSLVSCIVCKKKIEDIKVLQMS